MAEALGDVDVRFEFAVALLPREDPGTQPQGAGERIGVAAVDEGPLVGQVRHGPQRELAAGEFLAGRGR